MLQIKSPKIIVTFTGPSGSGKTTICKGTIEALNKIYPNLKTKELISHTTREMRENEKQDVDYHFISKKEFADIPMIETTLYSGNLYGLSKEEVIIGDYDASFIVVDKHGIKNIDDFISKNPGYKLLPFYVNVDPMTCYKRMINRGDNVENILQRFISAVEKKEFEPEAINNISEELTIINNNSDDLKSLYVLTASIILSKYLG